MGKAASRFVLFLFFSFLSQADSLKLSKQQTGKVGNFWNVSSSFNLSVANSEPVPPVLSLSSLARNQVFPLPFPKSELGGHTGAY